jgi:tetratricopeptide (TPR) repeat protein
MRRWFAITLGVLGLWSILPVETGIAQGRSRGRDVTIEMSRRELEEGRRLLPELGQMIGDLETGAQRYDATERYVEAVASFELQQYDHAVLYLTSLMEDPRFKGDADYYSAMQLLGMALFKLGNLPAASKLFRHLLEKGIFAETALEMLIEVAFRLNREAELMELAALAESMTNSPKVAYSQGKAYYYGQRYETALASLTRVPAEDSNWIRAQYIIGASLVGLKRLTEAETQFESIADASGTGDVADVIELANLALARLALERGDFSRSKDYYQRIPRESERFEAALYEVAHAHLRMSRTIKDPSERFDALGKAEEVLDILLSMTEDPQRKRDALIMKGRTAMYLQNSEGARQAYASVVDSFAATSAELSDLAATPQSIDRFFRMLVGMGEEGKPGGLFVSTDVLRWLKRDPALGYVVELMTDLARQREILESAEEDYRMLSEALSKKSVREMFPGFRGAWVTSWEVESRLMNASALILDYQGGLVRASLSEGDRNQLDALRAARQQLTSRLDAAPVSRQEFMQRSQKTLERLKRMSREVQEEIWQLEAMEEELQAMGKILLEVRYQGSTLIEVGDEEEIERSIKEQAAHVASLKKDALKVKAGLEQEVLMAGGSDPMGESEEVTREKLWNYHSREAAFLTEREGAVPGEAQASMVEVAVIRQEIGTELGRLRVMQGELARKSDAEAEMYRAELADVRKDLDRQTLDLRLAEQRAMVYARDVGVALFQRAKEGLVRAVLEADLGIVDLAWRRQQELASDRERLNRERAQSLTPLRKELQELYEMEESSGSGTAR